MNPTSLLRFVQISWSGAKLCTMVSVNASQMRPIRRSKRYKGLSQVQRADHQRCAKCQVHVNPILGPRTSSFITLHAITSNRA